MPLTPALGCRRTVSLAPELVLPMLPALVVPMLPAQQQYYGGKRMRSQGYGGWSVPEADSTRTVLRMISAQELDPQLGRTGMVPPPAPPGRCTFGIGVELALDAAVDGDDGDLMEDRLGRGEGERRLRA